MVVAFFGLSIPSRAPVRRPSSGSFACRGRSHPSALGAGRRLGGGRALRLAAAARCGMRVRTQGASRGRAVRFAPQRASCRGAAPCAAAPGWRRTVATCVITLRLAARTVGCLATRGRSQLDARTTRLREADGDRLLRRACAVLALANVMNLLPYDFPRLRWWRVAIALVLLGALQRFSIRHCDLRCREFDARPNA